MHEALTRLLAREGPAAQKGNAAALDAGIAAAADLGLDYELAPPEAARRWLISGNEAIAMGALRGGVRFVVCYPITPATDLVEWMCRHSSSGSAAGW